MTVHAKFLLKIRGLHWDIQLVTEARGSCDIADLPRADIVFAQKIQSTEPTTFGYSDPISNALLQLEI